MISKVWSRAPTLIRASQNLLMASGPVTGGAPWNSRMESAVYRGAKPAGFGVLNAVRNCVFAASMAGRTSSARTAAARTRSGSIVTSVRYLLVIDRLLLGRD